MLDESRLVRVATKGLLSLLVAVGLAACGGAGGGGDNWYYHWSCNGDSQCLATNPGAAGQASGTVGPEAGGQSGCNSLMTFGSKFWNIPPATQSCDNSPNSPPAALVSLTISPANSVLPLGMTKQFTATGHYSDGTTKDLTALAAWGALVTIGATPVATVTAGGLVTAGAIGSTTIIADYGSVRATTTLSVSAATVQSITVAPANPSISKGNTQRFTATGHYSDGTTADLTSKAYWQSASTSVATIDSTGLATGIGSGTSVITATYVVSGSATLTVGPAALVSIAVAPSNPSIARTYGQQLRAIGTYSDGTAQDLTSQVAWSSAATSVATIDPSGLATGVAAGTSAIQAAFGAVSGSTTLKVTAATLVSIAVAPTTPSIAPGATVQLTATGGFSDGSTQLLSSGVGWSSGTTSTATVSSAGLASAVAVGTSTVTASVGAVSGNTVLTVATTPPGVSWTYLTTSPAVTCNACGSGSTTLTSIVWSGSQFVAVALSGAIVTSPDGLTWTTRVVGTSTGATNLGPLMSVTWARPLGRFVAVGGGHIMSSTDGITWPLATAGPAASDYLYGVVWSGTQFVAVGYQWGTGPTPSIYTSPDGLTWTARSAGVSAALRSVAWSGSVFVAAGDVTLISADGVSWAKAADTTTRWNGITWTGSQFVEVGDVAGSTGKIRTSPDGLTWTDQAAQPTPLYGVTWTGMQLIALGGTGGQAAYGLGGVFGSPAYLATSPDGIAWTSRTVGTAGAQYNTSYTIYGAAWNGTRLVAVGEGYSYYSVYTSP